MLDKNKNKCPDWFDPIKYNKKKNNDSNEMGAVSCSSIGHDGPEILLSALSFPKALKLLEDPNIWIADMVATCNSLPHDIGAENVCKGDKVTGGTIFGDRKNNVATKIFELPGTMTDSSWNELREVQMKYVLHVPTPMFNLFSLTKQQKDGWTLHGDTKAIWIMKGKIRLCSIFELKPLTDWYLLLISIVKWQEEVNAGGTDQKKKTDTCYVHWCGKNPKFTNHLCTWGEAGTVKIKAMNTPKLADCGVQCVFIGYSLEHSSNT
jgi:hypothetical protein